MTETPTDVDQPDEQDELSPEEKSHRETLEGRYAEAAASYDKTVITLSGGALAISFAFIKDLAPDPFPGSVPYLLFAWASLGLSLAGILTALLFSQQAIRRAIRQIDNRTARREKAGGWQSTVTECLNTLAAVLFVIGVLTLSVFAVKNLGEKSYGGEEIRQQQDINAPARATGAKADPG